MSCEFRYVKGNGDFFKSIIDVTYSNQTRCSVVARKIVTAKQLITKS